MATITHGYFDSEMIEPLDIERLLRTMRDDLVAVALRDGSSVLDLHLQASIEDFGEDAVHSRKRRRSTVLPASIHTLRILECVMRLFPNRSPRPADEGYSLGAADPDSAATQRANASRQAPRELAGLQARLRASASGIVRSAHTAPDRMFSNNSFVARNFPAFWVGKLPQNRARHLVEDPLAKSSYGQRKALDKAFAWFDLPESGVCDRHQMSEFQEQIVVLVEVIKRIEQFANPADVYQRINQVGVDLTQFLSESKGDLDPTLIGYLYGLQRSLQNRADLTDERKGGFVGFDVMSRLREKIEQLPSDKRAETYHCLTRNGWQS